MKRSPLICFTGVDGSGKTTHAKSLIGFLRTKGYVCTDVWGGSRPVLSYAFFGITRLLGYWSETKDNAYTDPLQDAPGKSISQLSAIFRSLLFVDFQIRTLFRIRLPLLLGRVVIADRYFYDMLMELQRSGISSMRFSMMLSRTLPKPLLTFLLDAPENLTQERRGFSCDELRSKRRLYLGFAKTFDFIVIDSSKNCLANQQKIRDLSIARILANEKLGAMTSN